MKNEERTDGTFYGVGLGPGDPELMTRKAVRVLSAVDCIFVPAGKTSGSGLARRIVAALNLPQEKFRPVSLCMTRDRREDGRTYSGVADEVAAELREGHSVAWITEGDPLFFSTFIHVYAEMRARHPQAKIEIVPGVTSTQAAAASVGLPLASLADKIAFVPAAYGVERLPALLEEFTTVCLIKVNSTFDKILAALASGPTATAVYVENVGTAEERIVTDLSSLRGADLPYFSLVLIKRNELSSRARLPKSPKTSEV